MWNPIEMSNRPTYQIIGNPKNLKRLLSCNHQSMPNNLYKLEKPCMNALLNQPINGGLTSVSSSDGDIQGHLKGQSLNSWSTQM